MLVETASKGGNLLLNVGPTGEGLVPPESVERLNGIGDWMRVHADAIRGTEASPFANAGFRATRKGKMLYSFIPDWPASRELLLPGVRALPAAAWMMGDASRLRLTAKLADAGVTVSLPERATDPVCGVLACEFAEPVRVG